MKPLFFIFALCAIHSCNNSGDGETVKIPPGADTTGIYLALDSCRAAHPHNPNQCWTQANLDAWLHSH